MSTRESFVEHFGEGQAQAIEKAANGHKNGVHDKTGSDPFRWAIVICIGHGCVADFADSHGITINEAEFKEWVREHGDVENHDGDCDYLALFLGKYQPYMKKFDDATPIEAS